MSNKEKAELADFLMDMLAILLVVALASPLIATILHAFPMRI